MEVANRSDFLDAILEPEPGYWVATFCRSRVRLCWVCKSIPNHYFESFDFAEDEVEQDLAATDELAEPDEIEGAAVDYQRRYSNLQRSKNMALDVADLNAPWQCMVTLTSAGDPERILNQVSTWFQNLRQQKHLDLRYIVVPERGERNGRLHCHVLASGFPESMLVPFKPAEYRGLPADLKRLYGSGKLFHFPSWRAGFSTAVLCDDDPRVAGYIAKYMTKGDLSKCAAAHQHLYRCSLGLVRPEKKKIPRQIAATIVTGLPAGTYHKSFDYQGFKVCESWSIDQDKVPVELWKRLRGLAPESVAQVMR